MPFNKKKQTGIAILSVLLIILILLYTARLYSIQVINQKKYSSAANGSTSVRTAVLKAPRGEIVDRYGRQIAINRDGYNIVFNKAYVKDNLNDVILSLINLLESNNVEYIDKLPITETEPYSFKEGESTKKLISTLGVAKYATAENCVVQMVDKYELKKYNKSDRRKIMGVRYGMDISDFSISYPYTFAEDIPTELMRKISESGFILSGVSVEVVPFREYTDTTLAVNLIGSVGPIFEEDWEKGKCYKEKGYLFNDKVGKGGIEEWAEDYLHGTDGEITYYLNSEGGIVASEVTKEPVAGKTVMLTLDKNLQKTAQDALSKTVRELQSHGGTAVAGAACVVDIETGSVLCGANYPSYDLATLGKNYDALSKDKLHPLTNRAFQGVYPIGSTIKPSVAVAALQNGKLNLGEHITCLHTYRLFGDYQPSCMHTHGSIDLKTALSKSCNYYFFELGRRLGAVTLTDYFKQFGLGVKTGVEVDDSAGILDEPKSDGMGGNTLQIAIGQLNAFTPLQLANYAATFAGNGVHHKVTLIDKVVSYDLSETFLKNDPVVLNTVEMSDSTISAVKEGMLSVTVDGTGRAALGDYPIKIGGKTGTSQTQKGADHSTYIVFAPFDNPKIAISVVLEHGSSGLASGNLVRTLLDAYFFSSENNTNPTVPYTVVK